MNILKYVKTWLINFKFTSIKEEKVEKGIKDKENLIIFLSDKVSNVYNDLTTVFINLLKYFLQKILLDANDYIKSECCASPIKITLTINL